MELATDRAAYKIRDSYDADAFQYLCGYSVVGTRNTTVKGTKADSNAGSDQPLAANKLDITDFGGSDLVASSNCSSACHWWWSGKTDLLEAINRMKRIMDRAMSLPKVAEWLLT